MKQSAPSDAARPERIRVLFITRKWQPAVGGMETYSHEMSKGMSDNGHDVEVIALSGQPDGRAPGALALISFGLRTFWSLIFRRDPGDVVFGGDLAIWPLVWAACFCSSARPVLSAHGTDISLAGRPDVKGRLYAAYLGLGKWLLGSKLLIIANSGATEERVRLVGFENSAVVPLGCRVAVDVPTPGLQRTLLFAGRLVARKGLSWFAREVLPSLPSDIRLAVAGTKWDKSETEVLNNPRIDFLGPLPQVDLHRHMAGALAVVIPNVRSGSHQFEGFGLIAAEAAAAGGLVLAAKMDGYKTSVIDGETGTLLAPQDAHAWIKAISDLIALPEAERMRRRSLATDAAQRHFDWNNSAALTTALLLERH